MLNLLINFCLFVFIIYAVAGSAKAILLDSGRKRKRACANGAARAKAAHTNSAKRRKAKIIKLNAGTAKQPRRKKSSAAALCA